MTALFVGESSARCDETRPDSGPLPGLWDTWILENKSQLLEAITAEESPYHVFAKTLKCPLQNAAQVEMDLASRFREPPCNHSYRMVSNKVLLLDSVNATSFESCCKFTCEQFLAIKSEFNAQHRYTTISGHVLLRLEHMLGLEASLNSMAEVQRTQLVVTEGVMAPVIDVVGPALDIAPSVFRQHADASWISDTHLRPNNPCQSFGRQQNSLTIMIKMPRSMRVLDERRPQSEPSVRDEPLRSFYPALTQDKKAYITNVDDGEFVYYEHVTLHYFALERNFWKALVLFPPKLRYADDGRYVVPAKTVQRPLHGLYGPKEHGEIGWASGELPDACKDMDAWIDFFRRDTSVAANENRPYRVALSLFEYAIAHWTAHIADVRAAIDCLQGPQMRHKPSERGWEFKYTTLSDDSRQVTRQQVEFAKNLKSMMLQDLALIEELVDTLQNLMETGSSSKSSETFGEGFSTSSKGLFSVFLSMKNFIHRQLPTVEDYIHRFVINEQSLAAKTQQDSSIQNAHEAKSLLGITVLAVFYVPIQTSSSLFSMNIREISNGTELWVACLTIVLLTGVTVFLVLALRLEWHKQVEKFITWLQTRLKPASLRPPYSNTPTFKDILRHQYFYVLAYVEIKVIDRIKTFFVLRRKRRSMRRATKMAEVPSTVRSSTQSDEIVVENGDSSFTAHDAESITPSQLETAVEGKGAKATLSGSISNRVATSRPWDAPVPTSSKLRAATQETLFDKSTTTLPQRPWWRWKKSATTATDVQVAFSEMESAITDLEIFEFSVTGFNENERDRLNQFCAEGDWEKQKQRETQRRMHEALFKTV